MYYLSNNFFSVFTRNFISILKFNLGLRVFELRNTNHNLRFKGDQYLLVRISSSINVREESYERRRNDVTMFTHMTRPLWGTTQLWFSLNWRRASSCQLLDSQIMPPNPSFVVRFRATLLERPPLPPSSPVVCSLKKQVFGIYL